MLEMMAGVVASAREPLSINIVQSSVSGSCGEFPPTSCLATTNLATTSVNGGRSPYTYLWSKVSGDTVGITSTVGNSTTFSATRTPPDSLSAVYRCVVTDDDGDTAVDTVSISLTFTDLS